MKDLQPYEAPEPNRDLTIEDAKQLMPNLSEEDSIHKPKYWLHGLLFIATIITTTLAGISWLDPALNEALITGELTFEQFTQGLPFSLSFLGILTVHEFGHYIAARRHGAKVTLPYYIPFWLGWLGMFSIGTLGAFIRIITPFRTRYQLFDVGVAGPLAGYIATVIVLIYGYTHLPPADYIFSIHPEYIGFGQDYAKYVYSALDPNVMLIKFGDNPTMNLLARWFADPTRVPNPYEAMHYPFLFAGQFALFFTALNLFPIGQLDGGHILYGLVGPVWHRRLSPLFFILLVTYSGIGIAQPILDLDSPTLSETLLWNLAYLVFLYLTFSKTVEGWQNIAMLAFSIFGLHYAMALYVPEAEGFQGWLVFSFIVGRFLGVYHPPTLVDEPLSPVRKVIGFIALIVFLLSFSLQPFGFD